MYQSKLQSFVSKVQQHKGVVLVGPMAKAFPVYHPLLPVLGVDGGSGKAAAEKYDFTLGDGDSLASGLQLDLVFPVDKDASDLALALQHLPAGPLTIHLYGFWGGRFDHQVINLGELHARLLKDGGEVCFHTDSEYQVLGRPAGRHTLTLQGLFSLFSPLPTLFSIEGACRFSLPPTRVESLSSRLLSNEGLGEVTLTADQPFFCYMRKP
jgi:thiamine pyrophosphokinase